MSAPLPALGSARARQQCFLSRAPRAQVHHRWLLWSMPTLPLADIPRFAVARKQAARNAPRYCLVHAG